MSSLSLRAAKLDITLLMMYRSAPLGCDAGQTTGVSGTEQDNY